ncbi:hypothetical protein V6Z11_D11G122600 [Gossypium hirsutum]
MLSRFLSISGTKSTFEITLALVGLHISTSPLPSAWIRLQHQVSCGLYIHCLGANQMRAFPEQLSMTQQRPAPLDALLKVKVSPKEAAEEHPLQVALEASKNTVLQGSMDVLLDFRQLLDDELGLLVKLRAFIIDWVQEGFQDFFKSLDGCFLLLSGRKNSSSQDQGFSEGALGEKVLAGLVLVLAQLFVFIEQTAIPRISEEIAVSFSSGGARGHENGHVFVSGEICQLFQLGGEKLLHHYINIRTRRVSTLLRKRFTTPNWVKHKEPREVHMFVDLFLQEESVETTIVKLCLKSLQEYVRLQTFNRSGFQQIQLDIHFLRTLLKENIEAEEAIDFLLDEVIVAASERCLDPIPLEPPILDKLVQVKLAKSKGT